MAKKSTDVVVVVRKENAKKIVVDVEGQGVELSVCEHRIG